MYRLVGAPTAEHQELRAAWLQLAPNVPAWERTREQGVVSHRSAAALYGIGHLPADLHEFTVQDRKQTRRQDVRLHRRALDNSAFRRALTDRLAIACKNSRWTLQQLQRQLVDA